MTTKQRKITIVGAGNVGATIAYNLMIQGVCSEIVLVDVNKEKANGEAMDLLQSSACTPSVAVKAGEYSEIVNSDAVIITCGLARKPDQTRLELAQVNLKILTSVMTECVKYAPNAMYIIVANPVDVLTYQAIKCSGLPANQVIGTGTLLDSNRLAAAVGSYLNVDTHSVNAYVYGEHGDACMVPWSLCTVGGMKMEDYCKNILGIKEEDLATELENIYTGMVKSGAMVIKAKGATFYAIAASVVQLVKAIFSNKNTVLPVSTLLKGQYGADDICLSIPCVVNGNGVEKQIVMPITDAEQALFSEKIASLSATYDALGVRK